jgi:hypothetical protein
MSKEVKLQVGGGADGTGRNCAKSYLKRKNEVAGIIKLVKLWHAIGHTASTF